MGESQNRTQGRLSGYLLRTFESKERTIKSDKNGNTRMPIPYAFVKLCLESHGVKNFNEIIQKSEAHKDNVTISI